MATLTKSTGTVTLTGAVEKVTFPASYGWVWVKNMSDSDMFAGLSEGVSAGADGVLSIPVGDAGRIQTDGQDSVYLKGTGNALVVAQNYADCPFKVGAKGGEAPDLSAYAKKTDVPGIKVNSAVNADTLGEKSADDFAQIINLGRSQTDTKTAVSQAGKTTTYCCGAWIDFPAESPDGQGTLISTNYTGSGIAGTDPMWVVQFFISARTGMVYKRFINGPTVDSWCEVYSAANKPYVTGSSSGTSFTTASYDSEPSFAICDDNGIMKKGSIVQMSAKFAAYFDNLSDSTHKYIIFK